MVSFSTRLGEWLNSVLKNSFTVSSTTKSVWNCFKHKL